MKLKEWAGIMPDGTKVTPLTTVAELPEWRENVWDIEILLCEKPGMGELTIEKIDFAPGQERYHDVFIVWLSPD